MTALLDHPTKILPTQYDTILVTIIPATTVEDNEEEHDAIDIMEESKVEMSFQEEPDWR